MKIMNEYTFQQIKENRRHTFSILAAITIASALLCSLCIFIYSYWQGKVDSAIEQTGYWHGELWESTAGDKLKQVTENPQVECTMVKGTWITARLSNTKRPYFLMRDADKSFWEDMNLKHTLTEGKLPDREGEIVVGNSFFTENPSYRVGDVLTLPVGNRMLGDKVLQTQDYRQANENFKPLGTKRFTIVGAIDVSGVSAYPGYIAMGYLANENIKATDELTIYVRLKNPRKIYEILPEIAKSAGLHKDEGEQYAVRYNTPLLSLYGISEKGENTQIKMSAAMAAVLLILVMGTFILIIYNAFSMSSNSRSRELSILKSLGATPGQIKYSVLYEGFLLWLIQSPVGVFIGYAFSIFVISKINKILGAAEHYKDRNVSLSWAVIAFALFISLVTVLISAYIPARRMAKVPAVEGMDQTHSRVKKDKEGLLLQRVFGIEGELAAKQFLANRRSLRTAVISLSLCLTLISSYVNIISIYNLAQSKNDEITQYDLTVNLNLLDEPDSRMVKEIMTIPEVQKSVVKRQVRTTTYVTENQQSDIFADMGGFESVNDYKYNIVKDGKTYRIVAYLAGLDNDSFKAYCGETGIGWEPFYNQDGVTGILLDETYHIPANSKELKKVQMLKLEPGDTMLLQEKVYDDMEGEQKFDIRIGAVTAQAPGQANTSRYSISLILPMEKYLQVTAGFAEDRRLEAGRMSIDLKTGDKSSAAAKEKIISICSNYLGSEDFTIWSLLEEKKHAALMQQAFAAAVYAVALMIGAVGILNAFSTISNNLQIHKREYAMLRSVGLTPGGLNKMLLLEGLSFALSPLLISVPCVLLVCIYMLKLTATAWKEYWSVFPGGMLLLYTFSIFASIFFAYWLSSKKIKRVNIIDTLKDEIV